MNFVPSQDIALHPPHTASLLGETHVNPFFLFLVMTVATPLDITINLFQEDLDTEFNDIVEYQLDIIIPKSPNGSTYLMPEGFIIILFFCSFRLSASYLPLFWKS